MSTALAVKPVAPGKGVTVIPQTSDLFEEMENLTTRIRARAFGLSQQRGRWDGNELDDWFRAESELLNELPIEMSESKESFSIRAKIPGSEAKDLTVRAEQNPICIHGKSEQKKEEGEQ